MTPKKQKIYIVIIVICFLGTGAVLYFGLRGPSTSSTTTTTTSTTAQPSATAIDSGDTGDDSTAAPVPTNGPVGGGPASYSVPAVFPNDTKFNWTVLDSPGFKSLTPLPDNQQNLVLDPTQIGRDNPFSQY